MKNLSWLSVLIIVLLAWFILDEYYFGIYRNDENIDVILISKTDTIQTFINKPAGTVKYDLEKRMLEIELSDNSTLINHISDTVHIEFRSRKYNPESSDLIIY